MTLLTRISDLLAPPTPSATPERVAIPFGLTNEEWTLLRELETSRAWPVYLKALDESAKLHAETLIRTSKDEAIHFLRGRISGLREAGSLIRRERLKEEHTIHERDKRERTRTRDDSVLFGSAGWRSKRTDQSR